MNKGLKKTKKHVKNHGKQQENENIRDEINERQQWFFSTRIKDSGIEEPSKLFLKASSQRHKIENELMKKNVKNNESENENNESENEIPAPPGPSGSVNWTPIGPSVVFNGQASGNPPVSGRITALVVGPGGSRVYAGSANGGIWFSDDAGLRWRPLDDYSVSPSFISSLEADSLSIGAIAVRFGVMSSTDEVYVGTGEANGNFDAYFGIGIKHSASGGAPGSWRLEATNLAGQSISRIVIDRDNPSTVLAATSNGLYRRPTSSPFTTWQRINSVSFTNSGGMASDVVIAGSGSGKRTYVAFNGDRVYRFDGTNWTAISGLPAGQGRIVLAAGENNPGIVYALTETGSLFRLSGSTFQQVTGVPRALFFGNAGWYNIVLAVDPSNANTVYLGGDITKDGGEWTLSFYKGTITSSGGSFVFPFNSANDVYTDTAGNRYSDRVPMDATWIGRGIHADAHAFAFALNSSGTLHDPTNVWVGTDGGIFQSTMSGVRGSFVARNTGLAITQMTYFGQRFDTDAVIFGGNQDNGTVRFWGEKAWYESPKGDGGGVAYDPNNPYRVMRQYVRAGLSVTTNGGISSGWAALNFPPKTSTSTTQQNAAVTEGNATSFYCPIAASPQGATPTLTSFGTNRLWLTNDWGSTWITLPTCTNPYSTATPNSSQDILDGNSIDALTFASYNRIFVATQNAVWRFDHIGGSAWNTNWTRTPITTTGLPRGHIITSIAVENATAGTFYVALGGSGYVHVYYFNGTAWRNAGPPTSTVDIPCHAISVDPNNTNIVYLGSDIGCWKGSKTGSSTWNWTLFSQGLPEAAILDLQVNSQARLLRASTHGRGIWEIPLDTSTGNNVDIYMRANYADTGRVISGARNAWIENRPDPHRQGFNVYHWMSSDIKVRRNSLGGPILAAQPDFMDFGFNIGDYEDTTNTETADISGANRIFVQVHNRGLTPIPGSQVRVLLLMTDAAGGLPPLPTNYANHINTGDTNASWLAGSQWRFADPSMPYRTLPGTLDVRTPQVVEFPAEFSSLSLPAGHDHVCVAAFVTTTNLLDRISSTNRSLDYTTMHDKHITHRNLHLVPASARPMSRRGNKYSQSPQTFLINFYNVSKKDTIVNIKFDGISHLGHLSVMLPKGKVLNETWKGWKMVKPEKRDNEVISSHLRNWSKEALSLVKGKGIIIHRHARSIVMPEEVLKNKLKKLSSLDFNRIYVANTAVDSSEFVDVKIAAMENITVAVTVQAPSNAKPGDQFPFHIIQTRGEKIIGGSSYVLLVTKPNEIYTKRKGGR